MHKAVRNTISAKDNFPQVFDSWKNSAAKNLLLCGDAQLVLGDLPRGHIDCVITSPPYWNQRKYAQGGLGGEKSPNEFVNDMLLITKAIHRVLSPVGSFWLNVGDSYYKKSLCGIPWRLALSMMDQQGWILRNSVIWNKVKGGMDTSTDRLANTHEMLFHFVKQPKYYYDLDSIRNSPREALSRSGKIVSATGVSGIKYRKKIDLSTELTPAEKEQAHTALAQMLEQVANGEYADFRMVIRGGGHRITHSHATSKSGRAKELEQRGFYFLRYHAKGAKPSDVWDITPEDTHARNDLNYAAYPVELCRRPILATCPPSGIVLDPFVGTGTSLLAANLLDRRGLGIDISEEYIMGTKERIDNA